mmetsp:Transcript_78473/g.202078  ORF Transcript_78473/g.202078 Transcript_78473/m.202078 type:complete len:741 (-) Transcript_78473:1586-3808(-)
MHSVVVHPEDVLVQNLAVSKPREDVHLVPTALQRCGQLRDVRRDAARCDGVQRLPREHGDLQRPAADHSVVRTLEVAEGLLVGQGRLGLRQHLHHLAHAPVLVTLAHDVRQEFLGRFRVLPHVEAQAALGDGLAHAGVEGVLVRDRGRGLVDIRQQLRGHHQVLHAGGVDVLFMGDVLLELGLLLRNKHAVVRVDGRGDVLETEAIEAVLLRPVGDAGEQVAAHLLLRVVEEAGAGHLVEAIHAIYEELPAQAILAARGAVLRDAHVDADAHVVSLRDQCLQLLRRAEVAGRCEERHRLRAHARELLALRDAHQQQGRVAVALEARQHQRHRRREARRLLAACGEAWVALVDPLVALAGHAHRLRRRAFKRPIEGVQELRLLGQHIARAPGGQAPVRLALGGLDVQLVLAALGDFRHIAAPDARDALGLGEGRGVAVPRVEVARQEDLLGVRHPLLEGGRAGAGGLHAEGLVAVGEGGKRLAQAGHRGLVASAPILHGRGRALLLGGIEGIQGLHRDQVRAGVGARHVYGCPRRALLLGDFDDRVRLRGRRRVRPMIRLVRLRRLLRRLRRPLRLVGRGRLLRRGGLRCLHCLRLRRRRRLDRGRRLALRGLRGRVGALLHLYVLRGVLRLAADSHVAEAFDGVVTWEVDAEHAVRRGEAVQLLARRAEEGEVAAEVVPDMDAIVLELEVHGRLRALLVHLELQGDLLTLEAVTQQEALAHPDLYAALQQPLGDQHLRSA